MSLIPVPQYPRHIPSIPRQVLLLSLVKYLLIQKHSTQRFIYLVGCSIIDLGRKVWDDPNRKSQLREYILEIHMSFNVGMYVLSSPPWYNCKFILCSFPFSIRMSVSLSILVTVI